MSAGRGNHPRGTLKIEETDPNCGHYLHHKEDGAVKYTNQYGEVISIAQADEMWLNDDFFARKMAKLPSNAPSVWQHASGRSIPAAIIRAVLCPSRFRGQ